MTSNLTVLSNRLVKNVSRNSATILAAMGVVGIVSTGILSYKAGLAIDHILTEEKTATGHSIEDPAEFIKLTWRVLLPPIFMGGISIACVLGSNSINKKRLGVLASAYTLSENTLRKYQEKVISTIGERKEKKIREDIVGDELEKNPISQHVIVVTGKGDDLCYDSLSGRYFKSSMEHIKQAVNTLNHNLLTDMWLPLNEFYYELGLANIDLGHHMGWTSENLLEIEYTSKLTDMGEPCLVLTYKVIPDLWEKCDLCG